MNPLVRAGGLQMPLRAAVVGQHEAYVRTRQREPLEGFFAVCEFALRAAQEFAPCRRIEIKVGCFDDRAGGHGSWLGCGYRVAAGFDLPSMRTAGRPAGEDEMRY